MEAETRNLLAEMFRGAELTFSNAKQLFEEGALLREKGAIYRALFLHQISLEECGKIEIIGAWATNLFMGGRLEASKMAKAFQSHKSKNYANAYFATATTGELEAKKRGDKASAVEAFRQFQQKFHEESNSAKNASLYIDFKNKRFSAPKEQITEEMVIGIAAVNSYFLELTAPKVKMLERMSKDEGELQETLRSFSDRVPDLAAYEPDEMAKAMEELVKEISSRYTRSKSNI
jgi:AbiV family abortive infection protein